MKKIVITISIIFILILGALVIIPGFFKDDIVAWIKNDINKNFTATVDFDAVDLSLIRSFPRLNIALEGLRIVHHEPFAGDTLANIREVQATVNLGTLFGGPVEVSGILIDQPQLHLRVREDGTANWQITKTAPDAPPVEPGQPSPGMNLVLQNYEIRNGRVLYQTTGAKGAPAFSVLLEELNHRGSGNFAAEQFTLATQTGIGNITCRQGNATLLNNTRLDAKVEVAVDLQQNKYTLKENQIRLNALTLNLDGWVARDGEDLTMELRFHAPEARFKELLSLIPVVYGKDYATLRADGQFTLGGSATGRLTKREVPAFDIALTVKDGMFQYPDLPTPVQQVQVNLRAANPGQSADATVIHLERLHLEILNEPLEARLLVKTPVSDPYLETSVVGGINLGEVKNIFPLAEGVELSGRVKSDFQLKGSLAAIRTNDVSKFSTGGTLNFAEVRYAAPELPERITIQTARLEFSPQKATLSNFAAAFGKSDLRANGVLENIFGYLFHDQSIKGTLALQSRFLDMNPWLAEENEPLAPVELPARIEFLLSADFRKLLFDNLEMNHLKSTMLLKDRKLSLMDFTAEMLQGTMKANGTYSYIPPAKPQMFFDLNVSQFSIPEVYKKFVTVQKFTPLAEKMEGIFSASLNLNTDLDDKLMPVWQAFNSRGALIIPKVKISDAPVLNQLSEKLKIPALHNPSLSNLAPAYRIQNGRFFLEPLKFTVDKYEILAAGSYGIDQSLDYTLKVNIPAAELKQQTHALLRQFVKQDVNTLTDETVVVDVVIGGTYKNPQLKISGAEVFKGVTDPLKNAAVAEADKRKAELEKQAQEELERKKKELEEKKKAAEEALKNKLKDLFKKKD